MDRRLRSCIFLTLIPLLFLFDVGELNAAASTSDTERSGLAGSDDEPEYCQTDSNWEESRKEGGGETSAVSGVGGDAASDPIFFSHEMDKRFFCGDDVKGLDEHYHDGEALDGETDENSDLRIQLGYSLHFDRIDREIAYEDQTTDDLSDDRRALFQVLLRHQCFAQTQYNAAKHYPTYDWCKRRTMPDQMPSRSTVKSLLEDHLSGKTYAHENFLHLYDQGKEMRTKVVKAFGKFEENFPIVEAIYVEGPKEGVARYKELRNKHSAVYEKLTPITDAFENGEEPPADCASTLEPLQNNLAATLDVKPTVEAVRAFRGKHPTGRQITEALAYCYSHDPNSESRFFFEKELLDEVGTWKSLGQGISQDQLSTLQAEYMSENPGTPPSREDIIEYAKKNDKLDSGLKPARITKLQHVVHARQEAYDANKSDADLPKFLDGEALVPDLERKWLASMRPEIEYQPEADRARRAPGRAYDEEEGDYSRSQHVPPPVIKTITEVPVGYQLSFPSETRTGKMETCDEWEKTDRIESIEYENGKQKINYEHNCVKSSVKTGEFEEGFDPIVVSAWEGQMLEKGMQVYVRSNATDPKDSMVVDAWWPDQGRPGNAVIIDGVRVNQ